MATRTQIARLGSRIEEALSRLGGAKRIVVLGPHETEEAAIARQAPHVHPGRLLLIFTGVPR